MITPSQLSKIPIVTAVPIYCVFPPPLTPPPRCALDMLTNAVTVKENEDRLENLFSSANLVTTLSKHTPIKRKHATAKRKNRWDLGLWKANDTSGAARRKMKAAGSGLIMMDRNKAAMKQPETELLLNTEGTLNLSVITFKAKGIGLAELVRARKPNQLQEFNYGSYRPAPSEVSEEMFDLNASESESESESH
jgi:hypothetical protein